jgi:hypothetical protein
MIRTRIVVGSVWAGFAALFPAACSTTSPSATGNSPEGGSTSPLAYTPPADPIQDGNGHTLKTFAPPNDTGPNTFVFSASGEANAILGYAYPPYDLTTATYMVDGWNWKIDKYIVVIDHITLWSNPNMSASDQSQHGAQVAHVDGPFVVDLHKGGPLDGKGGAGEQALAIAAIKNLNDMGGVALDPSTTYAFGFSTVQAPSDGSAINVNLTMDEQADYQYMVQKGASVYYHGTATWAGTQSGGQMGFGICSSDPQTDYNNGAQTCASATASSGSEAGAASEGGTAGEVGVPGEAGTLGEAGMGAETGTADDGGIAVEGGASDDGGTASEAGTGNGGGGTCPNIYDFSKLPQTMSFQFAFPTPTNYVNCDNYSASELAGHDVRGVQSSNSQAEIEQVTVHMDHPFWESFEEDTPVHWNQIAAQYIGQTNPTAHLEDFVGVPFSPFTDKNGVVMPWQWCETAYSPPGNGAMSFSTLSVPIDPNGTCAGTIGQDFTTANCKSIRDYYDFIRYTQSTQGHLNSQGLCYIDRQYPAPAGGS